MMLWLLGALGLTGGGIGLAALLGGGPAMLLGLKWLWSWLSHATFLQVVCVVLIGALAVDHIALLASHRHAAKVEAQLTACTAARKADQASYAKAQADAAAANKAHVDTENKLREQINEKSHSDFVSQRDSLRAQSGAAQGAASAAGISQVPHAAPGTPPEAMSLPPAELLRAQETELQLNALIDWVLQQSAVDPNAPPVKSSIASP